MIRIISSRWHTDSKLLIYAVGLSGDTKPTEGIISGSGFYEIDTGTGYRFDEVSGTWIQAADGINPAEYVAPAEGSNLASGKIIEVIGIPDYIDDPTQHSAYGITEKGWYAFARIESSSGETYSAQSTVTGAAGYIANVGDSFVDIAVRFEVAAMSQVVTINWGGSSDTYIFKATDLAVRNLDYRTTFYMYDAAEFATWEYAENTDNVFSNKKRYYILENGTYVLATVTADAAAIYYEQVLSYALTTDTTFADGKVYYTLDNDVYTAATVTTGENIAAETYYEQTISYVKTADTEFQTGKTYYTTTNGTTYTEATVIEGDPIITYYVQSKLTLAGMVRNVTYNLDTIIDCPMEIMLPEVADDGHGAWFEFHFQHSGSGSITLTPTATGVKAGTAGASAAITAGVNVVDLQYTNISGTKLWTMANVHTNIPA